MMNVEHAGFIIASYVLAALVITGLIAWIVMDHRNFLWITM